MLSFARRQMRVSSWTGRPPPVDTANSVFASDSSSTRWFASMRSLHRCILEVISERGVVVTIREQDILADFIFSGIADAVTQYSHQRDAELRRQSNEHFRLSRARAKKPTRVGAVRLGLASR